MTVWAGMKRWQVMDVLVRKWRREGKASFTSADVALELGIDPTEASQLIQAGLLRKRSHDDVPSFYRAKGKRTSNAVYVIGDSSRDLSAIAESFADDTLCRYERAARPDMAAMLAANAETRRRRAATLEAMALHMQAFVLSLEAL